MLNNLSEERRVPRILMVMAPVVMVLGLMTWVSPAFLTPDNLVQVLRQSSILGLMALGVTFVVVCGRLDLSVGSLLSLCGVIVISVHESAGPGAAIIACLTVGIVIGCLNGVLVAFLGLDSLITTLGMMSALQGLALMYTNGKNQLVMNPEATWFAYLGRGYVLGIPVPVILVITSAIILWFILERTVFGRQIFAVGGNETASFFTGIGTRKTILVAYAISGLMTAIAAIVFGSRVMAAQNNSGAGLEITALAGVILGGTSLSGGSGGVIRSVLGVIALGILQNWLLLVGLPYYAQWIVTWTIIIAAVWINEATKRERVLA